MKITIIIPTYNEREVIGALIDALLRVCAEMPHHIFSILVVDSNSQDDTASLVEEKARQHGTVHLLKQNERRGLGSAYVLGIRHAIHRLAADAFVECDADFQHDPRDILQLVAELDNGYDYIIGSRYVPGPFAARLPLEEKQLYSRFHAYKIHLLYCMFSFGAKIKEVPIAFHERGNGTSKLRTIKDIAESLKVVAILRFKGV
ncbi:MAG: Glycosyltransferase [Parcubacteria group bacterium GW2011_GWA2_47_12]|nr:MAG: Glycosyltransferase [Parcubacteria group bacterium GW2011_GWA2_47_12]